MLIELPDIAWHDVTLEPEPRPTKGDPADQPPVGERLGDRIRIGGPVCTPITADRVGDDAQLRQMLEAEEKDHRYYLVHLACTFQPDDDESFEKAWVQVLLTRADGESDPGPISWSMTPDRVSQPVTFSQSIALGWPLKFASLNASATRQFQREAVYLEAYNELLSDPTWAFAKTASADLRGSQRLVMVVRAPASTEGRGSVRFRAMLKRKRLKAFPYRISFPGDAQVSAFDFGGG